MQYRRLHAQRSPSPATPSDTLRTTPSDGARQPASVSTRHSGGTPAGTTHLRVRAALNEVADDIFRSLDAHDEGASPFVACVDAGTGRSPQGGACGG